MSVVLEPLAVERLMPLGDRVIVERFDVEERSKGGIVIPGTAQEKPAKGMVVAVGPGKRLESGEIQALSIKVGDKVLFGKYAGTEVKLGDKEYIVMREEDVMAIITE